MTNRPDVLLFIGFTLVTTVSATDPNDDAIIYSIASGDPNGVFAIDAATGQVTIAGSLNAARNPLYTLVVAASDGAIQDTITLTIGVAGPPPTKFFVVDEANTTYRYDTVGNQLGRGDL